ncbi:MAG: hypothetical protein ACLFP4_00445 [Spirochaetales bacterium]
MSDRKEITSTNALVQHGSTGVGGIVGGGALLLLNSLGGPLAWIIGGVVTVAGVVISASGKEDRLAGGIVAGAGVLTILSGVGLGLGGTLLTLGGLGLIAVGAIGAYKFFKGLRARK